MKLLSTSILSWTFLLSVAVAHEGETLSWSVLKTKLPEPISDMTATLGSNDNALVYIAGGCNHPKGNAFVQDTGRFSCDTITNAFYSFSPATGDITMLPNLPRARYRHGAAFSQNRLWLLGGRTVMDDVILEVDVFDVTSNTWFTPGNLTEGVSDNAAFALGDFVYLAGGWNGTYTALAHTWKISATTVDSITPEQVASLSEARGDVKAVVDANGVAHVTGGFTDANGYCPALHTTEQYNGNVWTNGPPLQYARGDKALVVWDGHLVALGGETAIDANCNITNPDHGGATATIDEVEVLNHDGTEWTEVASIPNARFRFDAVAYQDRVFAFGGQGSYNAECECYATSNEIVIFTEQDEEDDTSGSVGGGGRVGFWTVTAVAAVASALWM